MPDNGEKIFDREIVGVSCVIHMPPRKAEVPTVIEFQVKDTLVVG